MPDQLKVTPRLVELEDVSHITVAQACEALKWTKARARRELQPDGLLWPHYCTVYGKHMVPTACVQRLIQDFREAARKDP